MDGALAVLRFYRWYAPCGSVAFGGVFVAGLLKCVAPFVGFGQFGYAVFVELRK